MLINDYIISYIMYHILPLNIIDETIYNIEGNSNIEKIMKDIIIWDEISMTPENAFEAVDRLPRDMSNVEKPFGSESAIISGKFRQILPVVRHGSEGLTIQSNSVICGRI